MAAASSEAYAERRYRGDGVDDACAAAKWEADRYANENSEPEHVLIFGPKPSFDELMARRDDRSPEETTRFGALARQLWTPLLDAEIDV